LLALYNEQNHSHITGQVVKQVDHHYRYRCRVELADVTHELDLVGGHLLDYATRGIALEFETVFELDVFRFAC